MLSIIQQPRDQFEDPNTTLRKSSAEVIDFGPIFQQQVEDVIKTFHSHEIAVGLAAPQVGLQQRFTIVNISKNKIEPDLVLVNPRILTMSSKTEVRRESCMSLPHFRGPVLRPLKVSVTYQDQNGKPCTVNAEGFFARVLCHEIDHLDGVLYVDKMDDLSKLEPVTFFKGD